MPRAIFLPTELVTYKRSRIRPNYNQLYYKTKVTSKYIFQAARYENVHAPEPVLRKALEEPFQ